MFDWFFDPLTFAFFSRALAASIIVGIVCAVIGSYVVLRGMAFLGDALPHAILPGVVTAYLLELPLALGALVVGIAAALGIGAISKQGQIKEDTAIGVVFAGTFALGVAMLSATNNYTIDLAHFLFGNLLGVSQTDLWVIGGLSLLVLGTVAFFYKEFMVISFDMVLATTLRLPTTFLHYLLLVLIAVTIVVSLQMVGIALMVAMLVTPAAAASLLTRRLSTMMLVAAFIGAFSGVVGLYSSFYLNIASGPAVVLVATAVFALTFLFAPRHGLLHRR